MTDRIEDIEIRLLLEALFQKYHYDFRNYALASVKRRLRQAREQLGFASISDDAGRDCCTIPPCCRSSSAI